MTPEELAEQTREWRAAAHATRDAKAATNDLIEERDKAIRQAVNEGMSLRQVAEIVGGAPNGVLTYERVRQVCLDQPEPSTLT